MTPSTDQPGSLRVTESVLEALAAHARADAPNECCGLLVGRDDAIVDTRAARNLRASRTRYLIDPRDHFRALRDAREAGLAVIGAYHSHPAAPAEPSETDVREATCPGFVYVIVSLASGSEVAIRAFRLGRKAQVFHEVELVPVSGPVADSP